MNTIAIGGAERPLGDADPTWIRHQFEEATRRCSLPCVRVAINTSQENIALQTPSCPTAGGGGRSPNSSEAEILRLWHIEGLSSLQFTARQVIDFVDRVKRLIH